MAMGTGLYGLPGIFDNVRDGLVLVRFPGREVVMFNRAAASLFGVPVETAQGNSLESLIQDVAFLERVHFSSTKPVGEWPGHDQDMMLLKLAGGGSKRVVEAHICRVDDAGIGGPLVLLVLRPHIWATLGDAIERGDAAEQANAQLRALHSQATAIVAAAAHEMGTPLMVMSLELRLLQQAAEPSHDQHRSIQRIAKHMARLRLVAQDIMDAARADRGELRLERVPVDLIPLVRSEVQRLHGLADDVGVGLRWDSDEGEAMVQADGQRIRQVVTNFVSNGLKYTPAGGYVSVRVDRAAAGMVLLSVADSGPGIRADDVANLFKPFTRLSTDVPGTGLGLYLCKQIIEAHGGTVGCHSDGPGKGSTFWASLPVAPGRGDRNQRLRAHQPAAAHVPVVHAPLATEASQTVPMPAAAVGNAAERQA